MPDGNALTKLKTLTQPAPVAHRFPPDTTRIAARRGHSLRGQACRFIEEGSPALTQALVKGAFDAG